MAKKIVSDLNVKGKKVLIRVDFNVPMKNGVITDDTRVRAALPTIQYVVDNGGKAIVFSHLGRVKTVEDIAKNNIQPVAVRLEELIGKKVTFVDATRGAELEAAVNALNDGEILMFQNTRYEDFDVEAGKEVKLESKNNPELGAYWASLGDGIFVNDAFGTAHRAAASNVGIASNCTEVAAGYLLEKEIRFSGGAVDNPVRPYVAILGGAKVSDKIGVISALSEKADYILVGGAMMFTFLKAQGVNVGASKYEEEQLELAKELMAKAGDKLVLPVDAVCSKAFVDEPGVVKGVNEFEADDMGLDVGPATLELFRKVLSTAKTVVWNGPMGVFEMKNYAAGTVGVCEAIADLQGNAITVIGGGDSAAAAEKLGYADKFSHVSTGGGASLEYLEGKVLPGIACVNEK